MAIVTYSRAASKDEMAREIDRRGNVIEALEAEVARLRETLRGLLHHEAAPS